VRRCVSRLQIVEFSAPSSLQYHSPRILIGYPGRTNRGSLFRALPYQGSAVRFYNNLQDTRGLPNYAEVVQDIACCGLGCGLEKVHGSHPSPESASRIPVCGQKSSYFRDRLASSSSRKLNTA